MFDTYTKILLGTTAILALLSPYFFIKKEVSKKKRRLFMASTLLILILFYIQKQPKKYLNKNKTTVRTKHRITKNNELSFRTKHSEEKNLKKTRSIEILRSCLPLNDKKTRLQNENKTLPIKKAQSLIINFKNQQQAYIYINKKQRTSAK